MKTNSKPLPLQFQRFSFQNFSFSLMPTLNDIAITQMRALLNTNSVKRLK